MKFDYIREFVTAADSVELQKAAAELGISPSLLTKHMSALEIKAGTSLFMRRRTTTLSRYGEAFLPYAAAFVRLQDRYRKDFSGQDPALSGELTIGVSPLYFRDRSRHVLSAFTEAYPQVSLHTVYHEDEDIGRMLLSGECDLAFIRKSRYTKHEEGLVYLPFSSVPLSAVLMKGHPLAEADSVDLGMLRYVRIFMFEENLRTSDIVLKRCRELGFVPDLVYTDPYSVPDRVKSGEGILLYPVPPEVMDQDSEFQYVPLEPVITCDIELALRREALSDLPWGFLRFAMETDKKTV